MSALMHRILHEQDGGMVVTVAFFLPVVIAFGVFVVDVGNAFEHRRHLQLQADAGVLAAGQEFSHCFIDPTAANVAIKQEATDYSGASQNPQIGGVGAQSRVRTILNGADYPGPSGTLGEPCETGFIDVKLTDQNVPPIFAVLGLHDYHAKARLQVLRLKTSENLLPIAAEDPVPRWARLIFVDESTGAELATAPLQATGSEGDLAIWDNSASPASVPITAEHVGVRVALSGNPAGGSCTDPLVVCYDVGAASHGLTHIRGWSTAGSVPTGSGPPIARGVELYSSTCVDPYFVSSACTIGVRARVDFGVDPATGASITATVAGATYALGYDPATGIWASGETIPVAGGTGPVDVVVNWEQTTGIVAGDTCRTGGGNKCKASFGALQRTFGAAPTRSGPIALTQVYEGGAPSTNSFPRCGGVVVTCTHDLVVKVGIEGALELSELGGPPVRLRIVQGSQNQSLDCDPGQDRTSLRDELWLGCRPEYTRNTGTACPDHPNDLGPQPWSCVAVQTGAAANQIAAGLNCRVLIDPPPAQNPSSCSGKTDVCTAPNMWPDVQSGSPRVTYVIVTPFGSFSGNGTTTVPVLRMAAFYITGWMGQGGGFNNPCLTQGDELPRDNAEIVGRFIKYVETPNSGGAGDDSCDLSSVDVCAAVLVE
jgi:hypothetical protein